MLIISNTIHIYSADLIVTAEEEEKCLAVLSPAEKLRANQFYFPIHRTKYIVARSTLRHLLSLYTNIPPQQIELDYDKYKKPFLLNSKFSSLQFNLAHSHDLAVYAFTLAHSIGIDIEKIRDTYNPAVVKRCFTQQENDALIGLPNEERSAGFYRLWSRKEALVKAVGKGLKIPLASFSVSASNTLETIQFEDQTWSLLSLSLHPSYQVALATNQTIETISCWHYFNNELTLNQSVGL